MKRLMMFALVLVAGFVIYNQFSDRPATMDEQDIRSLEHDFETARKRYSQAGRTTGLTGMDMSADMTEVVDTILRIKQDLRLLQNSMEDERALKRARALEEKINRFLRETGNR